jgi:hypothetical protein
MWFIFLSCVGILCSLSDDTQIEIIKYSNSMFCLVCEMEVKVLAVGLFLSPYLIFGMVWCLMPIATVGPYCTFFRGCFIVHKQ